MTTATTFALDRDFIEQLIVEVDAIAEFERIRNRHGDAETPLHTHVYGLITRVLGATIGPLSDDELETLHARAEVAGRALAREWFAPFFDDEEVGQG
ncbi:MAG TPA: hypothetical protein VMS76_00760 [Planctomycetota bacterium]|nr:hypothetical protein [Planctomycetota bacterium]